MEPMIKNSDPIMRSEIFAIGYINGLLPDQYKAVTWLKIYGLILLML